MSVFLRRFLVLTHVSECSYKMLSHQPSRRRSAVAADHVERHDLRCLASLVRAIQPSVEELPIAAGAPPALERRQRAVVAGRLGAQRRDQRELISRTRRRNRRAADRSVFRDLAVPHARSARWTHRTA